MGDFPLVIIRGVRTESGQLEQWSFEIDVDDGHAGIVMCPLVETVIYETTLIPPDGYTVVFCKLSLNDKPLKQGCAEHAGTAGGKTGLLIKPGDELHQCWELVPEKELFKEQNWN